MGAGRAGAGIESIAIFTVQIKTGDTNVADCVSNSENIDDGPERWSGKQIASGKLSSESIRRNTRRTDRYVFITQFCKVADRCYCIINGFLLREKWWFNHQVGSCCITVLP